MMFGIFDPLTSSIENALGITGKILDGEAPTKKQVAKLLSDGLSVAMIADATGYSVDVIERVIDDE